MKSRSAISSHASVQQVNSGRSRAEEPRGPSGTGAAAAGRMVEALTGTLLKATTDVHEEIVVLATSSGKLGTLTIRLNCLTYILIGRLQ